MYLECILYLKSNHALQIKLLNFKKFLLEFENESLFKHSILEIQFKYTNS